MSPFACGVTLGERDLACWGRNNKGGAPERLAGPFEQVSAGAKATCAIAKEGAEVHCFGPGAHVFDSRDKPAFSETTVEQISLGAEHLCALDVDGQVLCHGHPHDGTARHVPAGFLAA